MKDDYLEGLELRLNGVVVNVCNKIGCKDCGLKYSSDDNGECSATDLQSRIYNYQHEIILKMSRD